MAKGYPSKTRARKAFRRGVMAGNRHKPRDAYRIAGITNPRLIQLWIRGWELGRLGRKPEPQAERPAKPAHGRTSKRGGRELWRRGGWR